MTASVNGPLGNRIGHDTVRLQPLAVRQNSIGTAKATEKPEWLAAPLTLGGSRNCGDGLYRCGFLRFLAQLSRPDGNTLPCHSARRRASFRSGRRLFGCVQTRTCCRAVEWCSQASGVPQLSRAARSRRSLLARRNLDNSEILAFLAHDPIWPSMLACV